jgi:(p)ppGpp synthase/HD superfamily hydrolase
MKKAHEESPDLVMLTSADIVLANIRAERIKVEAADRIKMQWSVHHKFRMKFESFRDLI